MNNKPDWKVYRCKECGKRCERDHMNYMDECLNSLYENRLCFHCDFWYEKLEWKENNDPNQVIVDGVHNYAYDMTEDRGQFLGYGGSVFHIRWFDGREKKSNNMWCQGSIPDRFKDRLPDNAEFVSHV